MKSMRHFILALIVLSMGAISFAAYTTAVFQQGVSDGDGANANYKSDCAALLGNTDWSYTCQGDIAYVAIGGAFKQLHRYDVSSLAGSVAYFTGGRIKVYFFSNGYAAGQKVRVWAMKPANAAWQEHPDSTAPGYSNDTYASDRRKATAGDVMWLSGGNLATGVDTYSPALAEVDPTGLAPGELVLPFTWAAENISNLVGPWVADPSKNAGFLLEGDSATLFTSDDETSSGQTGRIQAPVKDIQFRPKLELDYVIGTGVPVELSTFDVE